MQIKSIFKYKSPLFLLINFFLWNDLLNTDSHVVAMRLGIVKNANFLRKTSRKYYWEKHKKKDGLIARPFPN
jgi:hypothetical protein